jgi:CRP-like cAMP-binding protein
MLKRNSKRKPRRDLEGNPVTNRILCSISDEEFRKLRPELEFLELPHHRSLHEPAKNMNAAYFLNSGLASLIVATEQGKSVEVGVVGCEGLTGMALAAGLHRTTAHVLVQIAGSGFKVKRSAFEEAIKGSPGLRDRVLRYSIVNAMQIGQTAACNRLHDAKQRLARWLLMSRDRISSDIVRLTHDFLAIMLGTDRPTVTLAAKALRHAGAIKYGRRSLTIIDRKLLERASCECYFAVRQFNSAVGL